MFSDKLLPLEFSETILLLQKLVPSTFSQTKDIDQINPLIKRAITLKHRDAIHFQKNPPKFDEEEVLPKKQDKQKAQTNPEQNKAREEMETNYKLFLGGAVISIFLASLGYYLSKKKN